MVVIKLKHGSRINYINTVNGEPGSSVSTGGKFMIHTSRIYKIPVDTEKCIDDHNIFKVKGIVNELIDIRNVEGGFASILPIVNNIVLEDGQELGSFI